jgi:hypothetical protein
MPYALQVFVDPDRDGKFRWLVMEVRPAGAGHFIPHSAGDCGLDSYEAALNAGTLALAAADRQPYENEATDPVATPTARHRRRRVRQQGWANCPPNRGRCALTTRLSKPEPAWRAWASTFSATGSLHPAVLISIRPIARPLCADRRNAVRAMKPCPRSKWWRGTSACCRDSGKMYSTSSTRTTLESSR